MKHFSDRIIAFLDAILLHTVILYGAVYFGIMRTDFFMNLYTTKYDITSSLSITTKDLRKVVDAFLSYIKGQSSGAQTAVTIDGNLQPFFNEKELAHLKDIAGIVQTCNRTALIILIVILLLTVFLLLRKSIRKLISSWLLAMLLFAAAAGVIAIMYTNNPLHMIILFHETFFTNDLWLLNSTADRFLTLFPTSIYADFLIGIAQIMGTLYLTGTEFCAAVLVTRHSKSAPDAEKL